ncbi:hypothetical protein [Nocardioides kribbensis]|uniref:Uncharacterized protein n=1 Tax=Nocardioides kribbensis TaxID=305517 RepID=A0ABV1NZ38_9ACTN
MNAAQVQADRIRAEREAAGTLGKVAPVLILADLLERNDPSLLAARFRAGEVAA